MKIDAGQLEEYERDGFLMIQDVFTPGEIERIKSRLEAEYERVSPSRILEKDGKTVRSIYGSHRTDEHLALLSRDDRLVEPARLIVGDDVYIHQFKVNLKHAFSGDAWSWHQDFIFWVREDGILKPSLTTAAVFLDDVNEFNGPLALIPGSHKRGLIDVAPRKDDAIGGDGLPWWVSDLTADIKFEVPREVVAELAIQQQPVAPKGRAGSLLFFHPNVVHGSASNISPYDRAVLLVTYNSVANLPTSTVTSRPDFLCGRDFAPLRSVAAAAVIG